MERLKLLKYNENNDHTLINLSKSDRIILNYKPLSFKLILIDHIIIVVYLYSVYLLLKFVNHKDII